jgi:Protein of unknown function (DUF3054)
VRRPAAAFAVDVACVLLFAGLGRSSHDESAGLAGYAETAWPFLAGLAIGWVLARALLRRWPWQLWHAVPIWLGTVVGGMALRAITDQGTAPAFVMVATLVVGILLFGWRGLALTLQWLQRWVEVKGTEAAAKEHRERLLEERAAKLLREHRKESE